MTFASDPNEQRLPADDQSSSEVSNVEPDKQATPNPPEIEDKSGDIEDLTLAEVFSQILHAPSYTIRSLRQIISAPDADEVVESADFPPPPRAEWRPRFNMLANAEPLSDAERRLRQRDAIQLSIRAVAFIVAVYADWIMANDRAEETGLATGLSLLLLAFIIWVVGDAYFAWSRRREPREVPVEEADELPTITVPATRWSWDFWPLTFRIGGGLLAAAMSIVTLAATTNNKFTILGVVMWIASTTLWVIVLAPPTWSISALIGGIRHIKFPRGWTLLGLIIIMLVAGLFRFTDLSTIPSEMTSDHVEKILDSQRILDGNPQVFFPNNGGREPIQFYTIAVISHIPGLGMNFFTLKFLTAVEGMLCIPVLWWMGREIIGEWEPELGNVVGLLLAALVAVSYWHTMLSRLGLRIVLTVIVTGLLMVYFSRALRHNRRGDFIKSGLILGAGVYAYQAARMLPVVVIAGVVLAIIFSLFRARRWAQIRLYIVNTIILVVITLAVFVPMAGFVYQYPDDFWRRTSGRLLGDDTVQTTDANGQIVTRIATLDERMAAFQQNVGILVNNIRNALLMYNWKGDVAWITAVPNRPEMDILTGALMIVGLGAWLVRMFKRRDVVDWLMPASLFIMLLPSALSIAYPIENPSATRTSGSLPAAYLFAAIPLALVWFAIRKLMPSRVGTVVSTTVVVVIVFFAASANWNTYFVDFNESYTKSSPAPYTEAGRFLRGFADSGGALGNAFMIAYPYWWDHRAMGIEAGVTDFPNGIVTRDDVPRFIKDTAQRQDKYKLDPDRDLLFFYDPVDTETQENLQKWFPNGEDQLIHSYKPGDDFGVYRVPKLGAQGLQDFEVKTGVVSQ